MLPALLFRYLKRRAEHYLFHPRRLKYVRCYFCSPKRIRYGS